MHSLKKFITPVLLLAVTVALALLLASCGQEYTVTYKDVDGNDFTVTFTEKTGNRLPPMERILGYKTDGYRLYTEEGKYGRLFFNSDGSQVEGVEIEDGLVLYQEYLRAEIAITLDAGEGLFESGERSLVLEAPYTGSLDIVERKLFSESVPTYEHYVFDKWVDANGVEFRKDSVLDESRPLDLENNTLTLYACYKPREYVITIDYGRPDMGVYSCRIPYGQGLDGISLKDDGVGAEVKGWTLTKGSEEIYTGTVYGDMTIYPVWRYYKSVELVHTVNHSERIKVYTDTQTEALLPTPSRNGYAFLGWYSSPDSAIAVDNPVSVGNLLSRYYARWSIEKYTLSFRTGTDENINGVEYSIGSVNELPSPARRGYSFVGWITEGYTQPFLNIPTDMYGNKTLEAVWEANRYKVVLDANGGELSRAETEVDYNSAYTLPVPERTGHRFVGWYITTEEGAVRITDGDGRALDFWGWTADMSAYAEYEIRSYTVRYEAGNGTDVVLQTYNYGELIVFPEAPVRDGYSFGGWYDSAYTAEYSPADYVSMDMTLYARWVNSIPISSAEELRAIELNSSAYYHLTCDINLGGASWTPIPQFSGTLDGMGYAIYNGDISALTNGAAGIFAINEGTVKNLTVRDFVLNFATTVSGGSQLGFSAGVIVGINKGKILNCHVEDARAVATLNLHPNLREATAIGSLKLGGIAGSSTGEIDGCISYAGISAYLDHHYVKDFNNGNAVGKGYLYVGGLVGENGGDIHASVFQGAIVSHTDCTGQSTGADIYNYNYVGGIAAYNGGVIDGCYASAEINAKSTDSCGQTTWQSSTYSYVYAGGISATNARTIADCGSKGTITTDCQLGGFDVNGDYVKLAYVGGLCAEGLFGSEIANSLSSTNIGQGAGNDRIAGAFIAINSGKILNCYADGEMIIPGGYSACFAGVNLESGTISGSIAYGDVLLSSAYPYGAFVADNRGAIRSSVYSDGVQYRVGDSVLELPYVDGVSCVTYGELSTGRYQVARLSWSSEHWMLTDEGIRLVALAVTERIK